MWIVRRSQRTCRTRRKSVRAWRGPRGGNTRVASYHSSAPPPSSHSWQRSAQRTRCRRHLPTHNTRQFSGQNWWKLVAVATSVGRSKKLTVDQSPADIVLPTRKIGRKSVDFEITGPTHARTHTFSSPLSRTTRVGWYQKKHSHTNTHPVHQTSFINFLHLLRSTASSVLSLHTWQSFSTTSLHVLFGLTKVIKNF